MLTKRLQTKFKQRLMLVMRYSHKKTPMKRKMKQMLRKRMLITSQLPPKLLMRLLNQKQVKLLQLIHLEMMLLMTHLETILWMM